MSTQTLAHHRRSDNMYRFTFGVQTITVTRRFLPSRSVRVRVTSETVSGKGEGNWSEYRDFTDMHEGDAAYSKQARNWCAKWEERYVSSPAKKETPVSDEPTQEPTHPATPEAGTAPQPTATQWEGGATLTPARAAELATQRTGIQHVVGEDGRTLCQRPATLSARGTREVAAQAVEGKVVGRVLGEYVLRLPKGARMGRSDAMLMLLKAQTNHLHAAEMAAHALRSSTGSKAEQADIAADLQVKAAYFRALRDAGYAADTTWDELITMLQPIVSTALQGLDDQRAALGTVNRIGQRSIQRSIDAAELFLEACKPILYFFQPDEEDEDGTCPDCHETLDEAEDGPEKGTLSCPNGCENV